MAVLPILELPHPVLRRRARKVREIGAKTLRLAYDMVDTMRDAGGIGLAANQINVNLNLIVLDITHLEEYKKLEPMVLINTEILEENGKIGIEEGCLSIPEIRATISRAESILITYYDEFGECKKNKFDGMLCRVILHEIDHLNGKLFTDYLSPAKRKLVHSKLLEISEDGFPSTGVIL